jgi:hypothetical protein
VRAFHGSLIQWRERHNCGTVAKERHPAPNSTTHQKVYMDAGSQQTRFIFIMSLSRRMSGQQ